MTRPLNPGFTLVELLVVITIIVTLLALLSPALDQAIYQAELAVCGTRQHTASFGLTTYAMDHKRYYPPKSMSAAGPAEYLFAKTGAPGVTLVFFGDDRLMYRGYIDINKALNDPMLPAINMTDNTPETTWSISSPINIFAGYYQKDGQPMRKVGDRMVYVEGGIADSFNVMVGDHVLNSLDKTWGRSSHIDKAGTWHLKVFQDAPNPWLVNAGAGGVNVGGTIAGNGGGNVSTMTFAQWIGGKAPPYDNHLDANFAFQDGSVRRFNNIRFVDDPRMEELFLWGDKTQITDQFIQLPKDQ